MLAPGSLALIVVASIPLTVRLPMVREFVLANKGCLRTQIVRKNDSGSLKKVRKKCIRYTPQSQKLGCTGTLSTR